PGVRSRAPEAGGELDARLDVQALLTQGALGQRDGPGRFTVTKLEATRDLIFRACSDGSRAARGRQGEHGQQAQRAPDAVGHGRAAVHRCGTTSLTATRALPVCDSAGLLESQAVQRWYDAMIELNPVR